VLVADPIAAEGVERLREHLSVDENHRLEPAELVRLIGEYEALVIRSETRVTRDVLEAGKRLRVVARAGVGVDNVDVEAATRCGVIVINSPEGNTIAAAEHTVAMLLALSRKIPEAAASIRRGEWQRGRFLGVEVYNKVIGVVGLGKIGREVARRCRGLGMVVLASDAYVPADVARRDGAELVELDVLIERADYITVHTPLNRETRGLFSDAAFARMKPGVRLINCARGGVIDEAALLRALESGKCAGAALDVFTEEPLPTGSPLRGHAKILATPHLGASTEEAQVNIAVDVADQILAVLDGRPPRTAVNMPAVGADVYTRVAPYIQLGQGIGRLLAQLSDGAVTSVDVSYSGDVLALDVQPVTRGILVGLLRPILDQGVNFVNALYLAEQRGIRVTESKRASGSTGPSDGFNELRVEIQAAGGKHAAAGAVLARNEVRIREIDGFNLDLRPEGLLLFVRHSDRPGVIGKVGTLLGAAGVNIAGMYVGREAVGKRAIMVLTVDAVAPDLLEAIRTSIDAEMARQIEL
jgi:D-3-phosphoglycerate dehydrogenase